MNIEETNKLIAGFMGYKKCTRCENCGLVTADGKDFKFEKSLRYHSSWDFLMPVVEKIEELGYQVDIDGKRCEIITDPEKACYLYDAPTKIEAVYTTIISFINYYNAKN